MVVVGGGAAGMAAASRAKRLNPKLDVTVFERTKWVSFALCGIPYLAGCTVKTLDQLLYYKPEEFVKKRGIDLRLETEVINIDGSRKKVVYRNLKTGAEEEIDWDYLILAPGARSKAPKLWPEINDFENVFYIKHIESGDEIRRYALKLPYGSKAVIIGAGYVGLEMAENLSKLGLKVTVVEALGQVAPKVLDPELAEKVEAKLAYHGVKVVKNSPVKEFVGNGRKAKKVVTENSEIEGDIFVVGVGIEPNTDLAKKLGLKIGETGAVWTDEHVRTSRKDVYAVGDVAEHKDIVTERMVWRPFAPAANKMGYVAGTNVAGREAIFPGSVGTSTFKTFDVVVATTGLNKAEAEKLGFKVVEASLTAHTIAHYMPGGKEVSLKVLADLDTGRLLGAQAVGEDESAFWRINVIASLLTTKATVWDLFVSDVGYAPPLSPVWDPLIIAARLLMRKLGEVPKKTV